MNETLLQEVDSRSGAMNEVISKLYAHVFGRSQGVGVMSGSLVGGRAGWGRNLKGKWIGEFCGGSYVVM